MELNVLGLRPRTFKCRLGNVKSQKEYTFYLLNWLRLQGLFLLSPARCLIIRPYADSSELSYSYFARIPLPSIAHLPFNNSLIPPPKKKKLLESLLTVGLSNTFYISEMCWKVLQSGDFPTLFRDRAKMFRMNQLS